MRPIQFLACVLLGCTAALAFGDAPAIALGAGLLSAIISVDELVTAIRELGE